MTSTGNRRSIAEHGLDCSRMADTPGIAGSRIPEVDGVFLCLDLDTVQFFIAMNNTGGPVDVWAVDGVDESDLARSDNGFFFVTEPVAPSRLTSLDQDVPRVEPVLEDGGGGAYSSTLTITLDGGTVLADEAAHQFIKDRDLER